MIALWVDLHKFTANRSHLDSYWQIPIAARPAGPAGAAQLAEGAQTVAVERLCCWTASRYIGALERAAVPVYMWS